MPQIGRNSAFVKESKVSAWELRLKSASMQKEGVDLIDLSTGDPDFPTDSRILSTASDAINDRLTHYPPFTGIVRLRQALAQHMKKNFNDAITDEHIHVHSGAQNAFYVALCALLAPGDEVILLDPCYHTYEPTVSILGGRAVFVPCGRGFSLNLDGLHAAMTAKTRVIVINTPSNPSGDVYTRSEMQEIYNIAQEFDTWIVSDEVYGGITDPEIYSSSLYFPDALSRVVYISSFSKTHAMTGWRLGWTVSRPDVVNMMAAVSSCAIFGSCTFAQYGAVKAVELMSQSAQATQTWCDGNRKIVINALSQLPNIHVHPSQAGMFALFDVSKTGLTAPQFCQRLLDEEYVFALDAEVFGSSLKGWVRVSCVISRPNLEKAIERVSRFCQRLAREHNTLTHNTLTHNALTHNAATN